MKANFELSRINGIVLMRLASCTALDKVKIGVFPPTTGDDRPVQGKRTLFLQCLRHKGFSYYLVLLLKFKTLAT